MELSILHKLALENSQTFSNEFTFLNILIGR